MTQRYKRLSPQQVAAIVAAAVASQQHADAPANRMTGWQLRGRGYDRWSARPRSWAVRSRRDQLTER